jgi:hypothetical protein
VGASGDADNRTGYSGHDVDGCGAERGFGERMCTPSKEPCKQNTYLKGFLQLEIGGYRRPINAVRSHKAVTPARRVETCE